MWATNPFGFERRERLQPYFVHKLGYKVASVYSFAAAYDYASIIRKDAKI